MGRLDAKVAIITGAASGIGCAIAKAFTGEGATVVIADINETAGAQAAREFSSGAGRAVFHRVDVTSEQDFRDVVEKTVKDFERLDIMVNNAGGGPWSSFERTTLEDWDKTFALTVRSAFLGMRLAIPHMRKAGGGSIISIASNAGIRGMPPLHAYSAAKAGVINLTASVARMVGKDFIRVNCISPGLIATPASRSAVPDADAAYARAQPIPKAGAPEDIAAMALFLASNDSKWVSGATMVVDGGQNTAEAVPMNLDE
ncbi:MAG TPA: SDR family NAD(P)-dependent oxidoreductase [Candidatus Binataceae bacterium]|jgi:NAD(P)-dependent dehydrogenase (short-subunit alcohol dehydrogenase family)|nr:SDR family NAD(P)-dependent oxidoreductase [Candidatus Binataceae bacterium]